MHELTASLEQRLGNCQVTVELDGSGYRVYVNRPGEGHMEIEGVELKALKGFCARILSAVEFMEHEPG